LADKFEKTNIGGVAVALDRAQVSSLGIIVNELAAAAIEDDSSCLLSMSWRMDGGSLTLDWQQEHAEAPAEGTHNNARVEPLHHLIKDRLGGNIEHRSNGRLSLCQIQFPLQELSGESGVPSSPTLSENKTAGATTSS
jgi:two-component sensor histidine kinase